MEQADEVERATHRDKRSQARGMPLVLGLAQRDPGEHEVHGDKRAEAVAHDVYVPLRLGLENLIDSSLNARDYSRSMPLVLRVVEQTAKHRTRLQHQWT